MGSQHSYGITLINNRTEKEAIDFVRSQDASLLLPDAQGRKILVQLLGLKPSDFRAFDLIRVKGHRNVEEAVRVTNPSAVTLIEVKSTKKRLDRLPYGFFFGATENEFRVAEKLGPQFKFCFVSLHKESRGFTFRTLAELEPLIRNKRTQFQINLASVPVQ